MLNQFFCTIPSSIQQRCSNYGLLLADGYSIFYFTIITNNSVKGLNVSPVIKITCSSTELAKEIQVLLPLSRISSKEPCNLLVLKQHAKLSRTIYTSY